MDGCLYGCGFRFDITFPIGFIPHTHTQFTQFKNFSQFYSFEVEPFNGYLFKKSNYNNQIKKLD